MFETHMKTRYDSRRQLTSHSHLYSRTPDSSSPTQKLLSRFNVPFWLPQDVLLQFPSEISWKPRTSVIFYFCWLISFLSSNLLPLKTIICEVDSVLFCYWVVKCVTSLCNSFCSNAARQVARLLLPVFPFLKCLYPWRDDLPEILAKLVPKNAKRPPLGDQRLSKTSPLKLLIISVTEDTKSSAYGMV